MIDHKSMVDFYTSISDTNKIQLGKPWNHLFLVVTVVRNYIEAPNWKEIKEST